MLSESLPAQDSIHLCSQNLEEQRRVENAEALRKPGTSSNQEEKVSDNFFQNVNMSLQRSEQNWNIPRKSMHEIVQDRLYEFSSFHTNCNSYRNLKTAIIQLVISLHNSA